MSQKHKPGRDGQGSQPSQQPTVTSLAPARTARHAQADGGQEVAEPAFKGAPPSNTAPYNCNLPYFKALRWGVDSLYLSYPGELFPDTDKRLKALKELAQSSLPGQVGEAQLPLKEHVFEVKERGASLFPYIIEDGAFRIQLSRPGHKAPMAYVKVSAKYLAHVGPVKAEQHLYELLSELGSIKESANVSRIDLYADFVSSENMESWERNAWVTRATNISTYATNGHFSGWAIGLGGIIASRLYNKTLEILVSGKEWILPLWEQSGRQAHEPVWRLEFELKREVLTQKSLSKLFDVLLHLGGLWKYATADWLRLTIPHLEDRTRSRWPNHVLWDHISAIDWNTPGGPLLRRFSPNRSPKDDKLFQLGYSVILSYMAKRGMKAKDRSQGVKAFIEDAEQFHEEKAYQLCLPLDDYLDEKLALKSRQFNSAINNPDQETERKAKELDEQARAYRKASGS